MKIFTYSFLLLFSVAASAVLDTPLSQPLSVLEDRGGQPIDAYLPKDQRNRLREQFNERRAKKLIHAHFPVVTTTMKVGRLSPQEVKNIPYQMASQPLFIVGYDPVSKQWLQANRKLLAKRRALGLVVNVADQAQMNELQAIVGKQVLLQPTPGDGLSKHLNVMHYPFYMDKQGVMR